MYWSVEFNSFVSRELPVIIYSDCAVVSLKPGHMDWVQDFDFMLNLFSSSPLCLLPGLETDSLPITLVVSSELFSSKQLRKSESCSRNYIPQRFGRCICSKWKYMECTKYIHIQAWTRACEQSVYVVCVPGCFIKCVVTVMVVLLPPIPNFHKDRCRTIKLQILQAATL